MRDFPKPLTNSPVTDINDSNNNKIDITHNRPNFLSLINKVIFQKWYIEITLVINKEFSLTEVALIDSRANMNCIQKRLILLKYYEKSSERLI